MNKIPSHATLVERFYTHWLATSDGDKKRGREWYRRARGNAIKYSKKYNLPLSQVCGIIAALSPRLQWKINLRRTRECLEDKPRLGVFAKNWDKALKIKAGKDPYEVLSGPKTRAFYDALMGDPTAIVLDTWMLKAIKWGNRKMKDHHYHQIAIALWTCAKRVGIKSAVLQATIWEKLRNAQ